MSETLPVGGVQNPTSASSETVIAFPTSLKTIIGQWGGQEYRNHLPADVDYSFSVEEQRDAITEETEAVTYVLRSSRHHDSITKRVVQWAWALHVRAGNSQATLNAYKLVVESAIEDPPLHAWISQTTGPASEETIRIFGQMSSFIENGGRQAA